MSHSHPAPRLSKAQSLLFLTLARQALNFGRCRMAMDFQGVKSGEIHMARVEVDGRVSVASFDDSRVDPFRENFRTLDDFAKVYGLDTGGERS